jgi:hypothetical protein
MAPDEPAGEWKARDKETYSNAITKKLINLGIEAKEDGAGEYYEDAVLDFFTDIPTEEKHKLLPSNLVGKEIFPDVAVIEGDTAMILFSRILKTYPYSRTGDQLKDGNNNRMRVFAIKQLTIDLFDTMEILRGKHRRSKSTEKDVEEAFSDWAPQ